MECLVILFIVIVILGAIFGGKGQSFGDTIQNGCGCLVLLVIALYVLAALSNR